MGTPVLSSSALGKAGHACPPRRLAHGSGSVGLRPMLRGAFLIMNLPDRAEPPKAPTEPGSGLMGPVPTGARFAGSPFKRPMLPARNAPRDVLKYGVDPVRRCPEPRAGHFRGTEHFPCPTRVSKS